MRTYGQYCPIARGAEIFAERWTPLIVRNLYLGCETFNGIAEGAPGLSRTLLSHRLRQLQELGVVASTPKACGRGRTTSSHPPAMSSSRYANPSATGAPAGWRSHLSISIRSWPSGRCATLSAVIGCPNDAS
jgi:RES domain-containing protein